MPTATITTVLGDALVEKDVVYGTGGGRDLHLDIYSPPGNPGKSPCILQIHGGGWHMGSRDMHGMVAFGTLLSQRGYVCVSMEYRLSGEAVWPAQIHDAKAALRWTRANAARLGIDPTHISVLGKSAGAHITLMMAATQDDPAYEGDGGTPGVSTVFSSALTFYPPTRMARKGVAGSDAVKALMGTNHNEAALLEISPLEHVGKGAFPPTLLLHGNKDVVVSPGDTTSMYDALNRAGVPVEMHMWAGLPHGFDNEQPHLQRQCADIIDNFVQAIGR